MAAQRAILHVDMDAFYASVEQRDNPELRGKPVVVGGGSNRGVVAAASYEVRKFGVRSAMPMSEALRRCPQLLRVAPRMSHYKQVSEQIFAVFRQFTPLVEGLSLDEAFLDVTASRALYGSGEHIAHSIKRLIKERTQLTASVGVAENKLVAKIASDLDKPDGLTVVTADSLRATLDPFARAGDSGNWQTDAGTSAHCLDQDDSGLAAGIGPRPGTHFWSICTTHSRSCRRHR